MQRINVQAQCKFKDIELSKANLLCNIEYKLESMNHTYIYMYIIMHHTYMNPP